MKEVAELISKIVVVLVVHKIISEEDKQYILGQMSEAEWIECEVKNANH